LAAFLSRFSGFSFLSGLSCIVWSVDQVIGTDLFKGTHHEPEPP
jgi:hypothetical protein